MTRDSTVWGFKPVRRTRSAGSGVGAMLFSLLHDGLGRRFPHILDEPAGPGSTESPEGMQSAPLRLTQGFRKGTPQRRASCFNVSTG